MLGPAFNNPTMNEEDIENYAEKCAQTLLLTENKSSL